MAVAIKKINGIARGAHQIADDPLYSDANLKGYWKFNDNTNDSGPNGYNLSTSGSPSYATGKFGNGIDLEKDSSQYAYINTAANLAITGNRTFSAWIKPESITADSTIIGKSSSNGATLARIDIEHGVGDKLHFQISNLTSGNKSAYSSSAIIAGSLYHIVGVYDGTNIKVYINGILEGSTAATGTSTDPGGKFGIGILGDYTGQNLFDGIINDVGIWDRALTDTEIYRLYNGNIKKLMGKYISDRQLNNISLFSDSNLVQYTPFEGNSIAVVGSNGTDTNITYTTTNAKFNQGASFNGSSSKINFGTDPLYGASATSMSFSIWAYVNPTTFDGTCKIIADTSSGNPADNDGWYILLDDRASGNSPTNGLQITIATATGQYEGIKSNDNIFPSAGVYHIVVTYDPSTGDGKLYVNSIDQTGTIYNNGSGNFTPRNANLFLGALNDSSLYMTGILDDFALFKKTLSISEVQQIYGNQIKKYMGVSNV